MNCQESEINAQMITSEMIEDALVSETYYIFEASQFVLCLLTLKGGFTVHGESANTESGTSIARNNAANKIFSLENGLLNQMLLTN